MKRLCFLSLIVLLTFWVAYHIIALWIGVYYYQNEPNEAHFYKAIRLEPSNPEPYYRLGVFYQWDLRKLDLDRALVFLRKAVERNPFDQGAWLSMARVLHRKGDRGTSDQVLERAVRVYPANFAGRWQAGNLLLEKDDMEKALPHFSFIISEYPEQSHLVYELFYRVVPDKKFILDRLVPPRSDAVTTYLSYAYGVGDEEGAQLAWARRIALGYRSSRAETLRHIDFLIGRGNVSGAFEVWKERLREENIHEGQDKNLVTNGSFEVDTLLGGGFDWRIEQVKGSEISYDTGQASQGARSLRVNFDGKENVDFYHVYQYVPLKANQNYVLKADMKTRGVTTKSGLKVQVVALGAPFQVATEGLTGDQEWKEIATSFRTPAEVKGGVVRLRRDRTDKFDRFLEGEVWLDNVRLMETE